MRRRRGEIEGGSIPTPPPTILLFQLNIVGRFRNIVGNGAEQTDESAEKTFGELRRHELRNSSLHMAESVVENVFGPFRQ